MADSNKKKNVLGEKHIRAYLEHDFKQNYQQSPQGKYQKKYQGLGLNWRDAVILIMALFFVGLYQVQAQEYVDLDEVNCGMMLAYNEEDNNYASLTLLKSDYEIDITGIVADVKITQSFINDTTNWIKEGMYAFPTAHNAAVYDMKLVVGNRTIEGEIHEKKQAQKIFSHAKAEGLTASIVKQYRPNLFSTEVSNIMPNEQIRVEISYQQTLVYDSGHIDFRLPLAIKSKYKHQDLNSSDIEPSNNVLDNKNRTININLEAGFDLSEIKSLYHDVDIDQHLPYHGISLNDNQLYDSHDFVLRWYPQLGNEPLAAMFSENYDGEEYVLMMLLPNKANTELTKNREVVFIIDTSGSMHGKALNAAKDALLFGLTQLGHQDKFNVIEFNSNAKILFKQSQHADANNLDQAIDFIDGLKSDGGTNMAPALALAMQDDVVDQDLKQIIFITDGSVGNEAQLFKQINDQIGDARLFTVAIGAAPNNYFMSKAALIGRGTYSNIANLNDVDKGINDLFVKLSSPAMTDIQVDWNAQAEQNPTVIPDLYSDQPIMITAKMKQFDPEVILSGYHGNQALSQKYHLPRDGVSKGIARLWARNKIEELTDDFMLGADMDLDLLQNTITSTALKHHLVSHFTSLVAVDKTPDISRLVELQKRALNNQLNTTKVLNQANFPQTALGWKLKLLLGLILMSLALMLLRKNHEV